jgi:hypothetical protein
MTSQGDSQPNLALNTPFGRQNHPYAFLFYNSCVVDISSAGQTLVIEHANLTNITIPNRQPSNAQIRTKLPESCKNPGEIMETHYMKRRSLPIQEKQEAKQTYARFTKSGKSPKAGSYHSEI